MQTSIEMQPSGMEIDTSVPGFLEARKHTTIMDRATLLHKDIHIPDPDQFMWIKMKQNYDKHVERMENWKDINEKEE